MDEAGPSSLQGGITDIDVSEVDSTPLELGDHLFDVQSELISVVANWKRIGIALRLKLDVLDAIKLECNGEPTECLLSMLNKWLKKNYDVKKFGEPTWQKLVEAVAHPAGGADMGLATKIAMRHRAEGGIKGAGRSRSAGETSLKAAATKVARKCKSESEANTEIMEQGSNSRVPVTQQTSPSPQGDTETETSSSPTISNHPFSPSPTPEPAPVKTVASSPTHHPQSNPATSTRELSKDFACENQQNITAKFAAFQTKVCDKLFEKGVSIERFRMFVKNRFPPGDFIPQPPASLMEIFEAITDHGLWDYFHYSPLVHIVRTFGANDPEMEGWVQTYKQDVKAYSIVTTLEDYIDADINTADPPPAQKAKYDPRYCCPVEWKANFVHHTLQYLTEVWELFSSRYLVPDYPPTALLDRVRKGCFVVTWLIPTGLISGLIERVKTDTEFFQQYHILRVTVGEECIYEEVTKEETEAVAVGEDWKLELKQKEMQQPKVLLQETEAVATSASEVQATPFRMEEEGRKLELYEGKLKHTKETGANTAPASIEQIFPSMKKKLLESSSSQERMKNAKDPETGAVAMAASVGQAAPSMKEEVDQKLEPYQENEGKYQELEPYQKEVEHAKSEMPALNPLRPRRGVRKSQLKEISAQKEFGGYDCKFINPPPAAFQTECLICQLVLREPHQATCCGTSFCQTCIQRVQDNESPCPNCRGEDFQVFPNKGLKHSLNKLCVYCTHSKDGCTWSGELPEIGQHLNKEETQLVGCQFVEIQCEFHYAGCKFQSTRKDMAAHMSEQLSYHTELLSGKMNDGNLIGHLTTSLQCKDKIICSLQEKLTSLQRDGASRKDEQHIPSEPVRINKCFTMEKFQEHKENDSEWYSEPFYTHDHGYKMCLRVDANGYDKANGTHLSLFTCFMKGEFDSQLSWPFYGQI